VKLIGDMTVNGVPSIGMSFILVVIAYAVQRRPRGFCSWLPNDAARDINLVGELLHQVDCFTADFILPPNPLISLVYINILGVLRWLNVIAGNPSGCSFEKRFRHFHSGISYVFLVTSTVPFLALTGWLVLRILEPRGVVGMDLNMGIWQLLLASFKTFNFLL